MQQSLINCGNCLVSMYLLFCLSHTNLTEFKCKNCAKSWINLKKKNTAGNIWDQKIQIKPNNSIMHHSAQNLIKLTLKWKMSQKSHYFLFTQSNNAFKQKPVAFLNL